VVTERRLENTSNPAEGEGKGEKKTTEMTQEIALIFLTISTTSS